MFITRKKTVFVLRKLRYRYKALNKFRVFNETVRTGNCDHMEDFLKT